MSGSEYQQLIAFLGERFETIDRRFEAVDRRFDTVDRRFEAVDQRFDAIDRRFDAIDHRLALMDRRFDSMDQRFDANDRRFEAIDQRFDELRGEILGHFDEIYRRLERLEQEYQAITQTLRRIEALLADERARREILERDLATLRENVAVLNARIEDIERRLRSG
jgi:chromosome segregation ATPase